MNASDINWNGKKEKNKKIKAGNCIFPFKYKWEEHTKCVPTKKGDICATEVNNRRTLVKYGYCRRKTLKKIKLPKKYKSIKIKIMDKIDDISLEEKKEESKVMKPTNNIIKGETINKRLIDLLEELKALEQARGKVFEARAYNNAAETLMAYPETIKDITEIKGFKGIGVKIYKKFEEFLSTGKLELLEREKNNPKYMFYNIYGVGPKKATELVDKDGIKSIEELRKNQELLNDKQKIGLKYYEDILKRIPRKEIETFHDSINESFKKIATDKDKFEIVGSFRRGAKTSGDIDIIISNSSDDNTILNKFITQLQKDGILIEILSKGKTKSLTIGQLNAKSTPRRLDFMYSPPDEFAFATLYFTGSKAFNVVQRKIANDQGYTLNEHGLYHFTNKKKGERVQQAFPTEEAIFDFLNMVYKNPTERIDGRSALLKTQSPISEEKKQENEKTLKKAPKKKIRIKNPKKVIILSELTEDEIIAYWKKLEEEGLSSIKGLTESDICEMFKYASDKYYNTSKPIVNDNVFDILKEYGQTQYPDNKCFHEIGAPPNKDKVPLPYFLGSMEKIKPDTDALPKYLKKFPGEKEVSAKLDGISALYTTEGDVPKLYTRGRATTGLNISHIIPYLNLPDTKNIAIRGELVIAQETFKEKYADSYKNPRNMVSGVIASSKKREIEKWKDIDFVGYEVINPSLKPSEQMQWLEDNSVITVLHQTTDKITNELLSDLLVEWRESYKYEIDGIIVVDNKIYPRRNQNPEFAFAFKMVLSDQVAEVKVLDVIWTTSKDGYIKPVLQVEPVRIRGADIEFVTAFNAKFVEDNKIGVGAIIRLVRSGDVIPHIQAVIQPAEKPQMPTIPWHWNETKVDAISDLKDDPDILQKKIEFFFKKLDIKGVGPGNVKRLINAGLDSIPKILAVSKDDLLKVDGFKEKTVNKIYDNIHTVVNSASLVMIASASNIFGRGLGTIILKNILDEYPDIFKLQNSSEELVTMVEKVDNVSKKRAELFVLHIPEFIKFMKEAKLVDKFEEQGEAKIDKTHPLYGKRIVMTGPKDKPLKEELIKLGAKISSTVNSKTFAVIVESMDISNNKTENAVKEKIPLMTYDAFRIKYLQ
jgi:NAD-dependent DNA ligase